MRAGKKIELKIIVDEAVKKCPSIQHVFVYNRTDAAYELAPKDVVLDYKVNSIFRIFLKTAWFIKFD